MTCIARIGLTILFYYFALLYLFILFYFILLYVARLLKAHKTNLNVFTHIRFLYLIIIECLFHFFYWVWLLRATNCSIEIGHLFVCLKFYDSMPEFDHALFSFKSYSALFPLFLAHELILDSTRGSLALKAYQQNLYLKYYY